MQLDVREVSLSYGDTRVLTDITFGLEARQHALLLGPSGSGKSSLLNIVCGLQTPDSGSVTLGNERIFGSDDGSGDEVRRAHMGIVFQTLRLVSALNVRANLALAQRLQLGASDSALIDDTLERLGITHRANARPFELSQGEAQRAAIARALVVKPKLLIADEPTSALDHANTQSVAQLLIEVAQSAGASLLIATHDDRLTGYFDHTMSLADGVLQDATAPQKEVAR
ncbi:MAG: ATP-binding cassette domain-containing protein [Pseudomonadota bacterium]